MDELRSGEFEKWLSRKLVTLNSDVDLEVYVSYIIGILEDEAPNETKDSLFGLLSEIVGKDLCEDHVSEIISKWSEKRETSSNNTSNCIEEVDWNLKMHDIINKQASESTHIKSDKTLDGSQKALILANYSQISDGEESCDDDVPELPKSGHASKSLDEALARNMNALMVKERDTEARNKAKQESQIKKQKDKEDREKQKQKALDRKENEKKRTQKGEKRR